ncbi:unnamed protein product [Phaeothamnion confervicola]
MMPAIVSKQDAEAAFGHFFDPDEEPEIEDDAAREQNEEWHSAKCLARNGSSASTAGASSPSNSPRFTQRARSFSRDAVRLWDGTEEDDVDEISILASPSRNSVNTDESSRRGSDALDLGSCSLSRCRHNYGEDCDCEAVAFSPEGSACLGGSTRKPTKEATSAFIRANPLSNVSSKTFHLIGPPLLTQKTAAASTWATAAAPAPGQLSCPTAFQLSVPAFRVVTSGLLSRQHAEFRVELRTPLHVWVGWRRHRHFQLLHDTVMATRMARQMYTGTAVAWNAVRGWQRPFRCLDEDYLQQKCDLVEEFCRNILWESATPALLLGFLSLAFGPTEKH